MSSLGQSRSTFERLERVGKTGEEANSPNSVMSASRVTMRQEEVLKSHEVGIGAGDGTRTRDAFLGNKADVLVLRNKFPRLIPDRERSGFSRVGVHTIRQAH
jgi:hypothetical protein